MNRLELLADSRREIAKYPHDLNATMTGIKPGEGSSYPGVDHEAHRKHSSDISSHRELEFNTRKLLCSYWLESLRIGNFYFMNTDRSDLQLGFVAFSIDNEPS